MTCLSKISAPVHVIKLPASCAEEMTPEEQHELKLRNLRDYIFLNGQIPTKIALALYVALAAVCMGVTPQLFPGVKAYYVLIGTHPQSHFLLKSPQKWHNVRM